MRSREKFICPILLYHLVDETINDYNCIDPLVFREHITQIIKHDYNIVSIHELYHQYCSNKRPKKQIAITFDDSYVSIKKADIFLSKNKIPYTIFVPTDYIGKNNLWNHKSKYITNHLNIDELRILSDKGVIIGSHTCSHQSLVKYDILEVKNELTRSREYLISTLDMNIDYIAYPYGESNEIIEECASYTYKLGFSVDKGVWDWKENPFAINRLQVFNDHTIKDILSLIEEVYNNA